MNKSSIYSHRGLVHGKAASQNSIDQLLTAFTLGFSLETDIRIYDNRLYISHDPISSISTVPLLDDFLAEIIKAKHAEQSIALNIKEDGLTPHIRSILSKYPAVNCVCFDMSVPETQHYRSSAIPYLERISEYEDGDCFPDRTGFWIDAFHSCDPVAQFASLPSFGTSYSIVVSPELHGFERYPCWRSLKSSAHLDHLSICTDYPEDAFTFFNAND